MINKIEEIPITKESYPFNSAERYLHISRMGYEEKEYYMYGTSNVYKTEKDGSVGIKNQAVPYINRFIVFRPAKKENFKGKVVVEILNATSGMDIERMWILGWREMIREGVIYIGITSKHNTVKKLKEFNPERYSRLSWANPTPDVPFSFTEQDYADTGTALGDLDITCEPGLFWDMLSDLARTLRTKDATNPVADYEPQKIILTGWSQSGAYMIRYINDLVYKDGEPQLFDGFLLGGPPRSFVAPLNQYESITPATSFNITIRKVKQPTIVLQTESDNGNMAAMYARRRNSNLPDLQIREYDVTGASHDTQYSYVDYYCKDPDLIRINHLPAYIGHHEVSNNYPSYFLFDAGYRNLFHWIDTGVAPATCDLIEIKPNGDNVKDVFGNTKGGLRTCLLDVPTGAYYSWSNIDMGANPMFPNLDREILFGHEEPFGKDTLKAMYGSIEHYRELAEENTKEQVTKGFIVQEDAEDMVNFAVSLAKDRGLE